MKFVVFWVLTWWGYYFLLDCCRTSGSGVAEFLNLPDAPVTRPAWASFFLIFGPPFGYFLLGWACVRHWRSVSKREAVLMCAVVFGGTLLLGYCFWERLSALEGLVFWAGFSMLHGVGLVWLLRKLRRIMSAANNET